MELNLNDPAFIKSLVDYHWMYCFNADCPRAAECIRFISAKFKPDDVTAGNAVYPDANLHASCSQKNFAATINDKSCEKGDS